MSPFQHGEVFVTEDGAETDLDLGHYERFIDENTSRLSNATAGAIYERSSARSGAASTSARRCRSSRTSRTRSSGAIMRVAEASDLDVVLVEIGGTVGDIESLPFLEAIRQLRNQLGRDQVAYVHCTLVPLIEAAGELKTKPTQHSVNELRRIGITPDVVVCRSSQPLTRGAAGQDRPLRRPAPGRDHRQRGPEEHLPGAAGAARPELRRPRAGALPRGGAAAGPRRSGAPWPTASTPWRARCASRSSASTCSCTTRTCRWSRRCGTRRIFHGAELEADLRRRRERGAARRRSSSLADVDGVLDPRRVRRPRHRGQDRGRALRPRARRAVPRHLPRHAGGGRGVRAQRLSACAGANSTEFDHETPYAVVDLLPEQKDVQDKGGTMRLGAEPVRHPAGHARARRVRVRARLRAPPPPLRGLERLPAAARGARPGDRRRVRGQGPRGDDRAARAPVLRGEPVPPRVQVAARPGRRRCSATSSVPPSSAASARARARRPAAS